MAASYEKTNEVDYVIADLIEVQKYHEPLRAVALSIGVLWYHSDHQLKHRGVPAYAYVRKTSQRERALLAPDAVIVIDKQCWDDMDDDVRRALVDHELYHLVPCKDESGVYKRDDLHRPVLRLRPHDVEVGWFREIAVAHGEASIERRQARQILERERQFLFPFATVTEPAKRAAA